MVLSLAHTTAPPLRFVVSDEIPRQGVQERLGSSTLVQHTPWFSELVLSIRDSPTKILLYRLPLDEDRWLQAACIGEFPDPFYSMVTKPDYGDALTALIQREWPDVFDMLRASTQRSLDRRLMMQVQTISTRQWVVADPISNDDPSASSRAAIESLTLCALETVLRFGDPVERLPGLLQVLGGPDRLSRRLTALSALLSAGADLGGVFEAYLSGPGPKLGELVSAFRSVAALPEATRPNRV